MPDSSRESAAPAAISNFFSIHDEGLSLSPPDLVHVGATGGGYMLSRGVRSSARLLDSKGAAKIQIVVNGDPNYDAATTRKAVELLLDDADLRESSMRLEQTVEVPISHGFGASAASALSGVRAAALALDLRMEDAKLAYYAHAADILCRTGLGTVSVIYRYGGAGIITKPGAPGVAEVRPVAVPRGIRVVTASLEPYKKSVILSSPEMKARVNRLGDEALASASDLRLESLVRAAESFSERLGLESPEVKRLRRVARGAGALGASQNMVGHAIHALVWEESVERVVRALREDGSSPRVEVFELAPTS